MLWLRDLGSCSARSPSGMLRGAPGGWRYGRRCVRRRRQSCCCCCCCSHVGAPLSFHREASPVSHDGHDIMKQHCGEESIRGAHGYKNNPQPRSARHLSAESPPLLQIIPGKFSKNTLYKSTCASFSPRIAPGRKEPGKELSSVPLALGRRLP
ncbi:uncharacterized protein LOC108307292 [Cebus imitator]|uniref:uncharacterized protein LOC108307292 n=1 Tax=Cebus imitator TaxID=2715852 RepID=UPI00189A4A3A|nr:uncharacterized protein LOC108307292 [Cebus imitator]